MEYTDAPSTQTADTMLCPDCGQRLPKDAQACDKCGWKREDQGTAEGTASDAMAALLSIVPGLGHVYKGYRGIGLLFAIGTLIVLGFSGIAAVASAGFGLGMAVFYWIGVAMHAYAIKDRVVPLEKDEGEQY
jgi:ribosomal protein L40E